jgi:hypothetical protein
MATYYTAADHTVVAGDVAYAADLNSVNNAVETAVGLLETDINALPVSNFMNTEPLQKLLEI